jgi:hypothetical protein
LLDIIKKNLQRGIAEELYRSDLNIDIVARFRLESSFLAFSQKHILLVNTIYWMFQMRSIFVHAWNSHTKRKKIN